MARRSDEKTLTVQISEKDAQALSRLQDALEGISAAKLARILLHFGILHADEAVAGALRAALESGAQPRKQ